VFANERMPQDHGKEKSEAAAQFVSGPISGSPLKGRKEFHTQRSKKDLKLEKGESFRTRVRRKKKSLRTRGGPKGTWPFDNTCCRKKLMEKGPASNEKESTEERFHGGWALNTTPGKINNSGPPKKKKE